MRQSIVQAVPAPVQRFVRLTTPALRALSVHWAPPEQSNRDTVAMLWASTVQTVPAPEQVASQSSSQSRLQGQPLPHEQAEPVAQPVCMQLQPAGQTQLDDTQLVGNGQGIPHIPQWAVVLERSVSQPVGCMASQFPQPASQPVMRQLPVVHDSLA